MLTMATGIMKWVSLTALVLVVSWRPSANYQVQLHLLACGGAVLALLAAQLCTIEIAEESSNAGIDSSRRGLDQGRHAHAGNTAV